VFFFFVGLNGLSPWVDIEFLIYHSIHIYWFVICLAFDVGPTCIFCYANWHRLASWHFESSLIYFGQFWQNFIMWTRAFISRVRLWCGAHIFIWQCQLTWNNCLLH
jgi:hypothetical protein